MKFSSRPVFSRKAILITGLALLFIIIFAVSLFVNKSYDIWLPKEYLTSNLDTRKENFIEKHSQKSTLKYGKATLISASEYWGDYYEARSDKLALSPSHCPNVFNGETETPSDCKKIGQVSGSDVYYMNRSLPSGNSEAFMTRGTTFIAVKTNGSQDDIMDTMRSMVKVPNDQLNGIYASNKAALEKQYARQEAAALAQNKREKEAYLNLPFTPMLPVDIPIGWKNLSPNTVSGSKDARIATYVDLAYGTSSKSDQIAEVIEAKASLFKLGSTCGPTPRASNGYLPCSLVPGTDYYEAWYRGNDFEDYFLYRPVGDTMVIIFTESCCDVGKHISSQTLAAQKQLINTLQPVDKNYFKNADYDAWGYVNNDGNF